MELDANPVLGAAVLMICISIAQESRRLALADMVNAARQCDLLEVRLDRFQKAAEIGELLAVKPKPVIMSCPRPQDGGQWSGTEEERLALLRQCIISKADYVEMELDVADQIRPFPPSQRIISYTNLRETPANIGQIYQDAQDKNPDVIKLVTLARTPEEAWPLVQILAKPAIPTVVVGLGKPGLMLSILGKKMGSPWTYAALERGMEASPGQPTIHDLQAVYHYGSIDRATRLIGVIGFSELEYVTAGLLNAALARLSLPARCLPLLVGSPRLFRKVMEAVRLAAVVVDEPNRFALTDIAAELDSAAQGTQAVDLLVHKQDKWHGYNLLCRAGVAALEETLKATQATEKPLEGRTVMVVGVNAAARSLAYGVKKRGGSLILAAHERKAAHELAKELDCRYVPFEGLYSTMHEVLVICSDEKDPGNARTHRDAAPLHAGFLKPGMTVMDLTGLPRKSPFLREAEARDCRVIHPQSILAELAQLQIQLITGQDVPRDSLQEVIAGLVDEEE
jgi:3-dehydroquinate dehydratase/shikimate dehydrogenase